MNTTIEQIKKTLEYINGNVNTQDVLVQFEKIIEDAGLYSFAHWDLGEVIEGPNFSDYWIEVKLMYPYSKMPEPAGGLRLLKYGCKVTYAKGAYKETLRVIDPRYHLADQNTKEARKKKYKIWIVGIKIPKRLIENALDRFLDLENAALEEVNGTDLENAYDNNLDTVTNQSPDMDTQGIDQMPEDPTQGANI